MRVKIKIRNNKLYTIAIAFLMIAFMYNMPLLNVNIATVLICVGAVYASFVLISGMVEFLKIPSVILPLLMYYVYIVNYIDTIEGKIIIITLILNILAISLGLIDNNLLRNLIEWISIFASI
ncbi:MAG: hypothetical protein LIO76_03465, partial [Clostridiales bacterium]|nr:hypothetical protein [Clostridiales bacterium]